MKLGTEFVYSKLQLLKCTIISCVKWQIFLKILSPQMFSEIKVTLVAKPTKRNEIGTISKSFQSIRLK